MRIRALLFAFFMVVVGVSATAAVYQARSGDSDDGFAEAAAAAEHTVTLQNRTNGRIWIGATVNADGSTPLAGLPTLDPGQSATITIPERSGAGHWRGKFFARQGCGGEVGSTFHCAVGDCGPYADRCSVGEQPASLAEFNFDTADRLAPWYNVSYVNAVSVPITITPDGVAPPENGGECAEMGCPGDLLSVCPPANLTREQGTNKPPVCVNPNRDAKTPYSDAINKQCPKAYAWSKQDAEPGNQTVRQCSRCSGLTVAFHGSATVGAGNPNPVPTVRQRVVGDPATVSSPHKGVALNPFPGTAQALTDSGSTWYHNWASSSGELGKPAGTEFVPTIWGPGSVTDAELGNAAREGKNLLGFNEPDSPGQANMSPEQALDLWPRLQSTGLRMGAPAVATGADVPGGWLDRFMQGAAQRGLRVDFIPVHWYGADFGPAAAGQLADYLQRVHDRYQKPIWLTEYALIDWSQGAPRYPNDQEQAAFIQSSTTMLDGLDFVERYAWFALSTQTSPTGLYNGTAANGSGNAYRAAD